MSETLTLDALKENFLFFDGWEDKYAYLIDLGKKVNGLDAVYKIDVYKVVGCTSNVWLVSHVSEDGVVTFEADSDALIVRGLISVLMSAYNAKTPNEIADVDIQAFFTDIGLDQHLSPSRRNGFFAMVERIKALSSPCV